MKLKSSRVDIVPLNLDELKMFIRSREEYERKSNLSVSGLNLADAYCEELSDITERDPSAWCNKNKDYLFYTLWVMIERQAKTIIGQFTFNGKPNVNGEVEVFFSIEPSFQRKGYAIEVMQTILEWGRKSELFRIVLIEADFDNRAAMASLKKLGFRRVYSDEEEEEAPSTKYYKIITPESVVENLDFDT